MPSTTYLHQLMTLPTVQDARLSPDKRWVAYTWYRMHENVDVFLVPSDGSQAPTALTHTPEATELVSWLSDSSGIIVSEDHNRDEFARLFRVYLSHPLLLHPLTEDHPAFFIHGGMLHPDGKHLFYSANYDFSGSRLIEPGWVYRHDLLSGERLPIARPVVGNWVVPELNVPGTHLIYSRRDLNPAGQQIWLARC
jgi:hypothetical protein